MSLSPAAALLPDDFDLVNVALTGLTFSSFSVKFSKWILSNFSSLAVSPDVPFLPSVEAAVPVNFSTSFINFSNALILTFSTVAVSVSACVALSLGFPLSISFSKASFILVKVSSISVTSLFSPVNLYSCFFWVTAVPAKGLAPATVSYTHLTLPTNTVTCRSRWSPYH